MIAPILQDIFLDDVFGRRRRSVVPGSRSQQSIAGPHLIVRLL
jgi:hypothetical protein